jgi:arylsulfatase
LQAGYFHDHGISCAVRPNAIIVSMSAPDSAARRAILAPPLVVACLLLPLAACDTRPRPLLPAVSLTDTKVRTGSVPGLTREGSVSIAGIRRPVLTRSLDLAFAPDCTPVEGEAGLLDCPLTLDPTIRLTPWELLRVPAPPPASTGRPSSSASPFAFLPVGAAPAETDAAPQTIRVEAEANPLFVRFPMPALASRRVQSPALRVPEHSILRAHIGIEEPAWLEGAPPVRFRILQADAMGDDPVTLFDRTLDPWNDPGHRRWIPIEVAVPHLGDRPFHLVFETIAAASGALHPSLPVWGDPTIFYPATPTQKPLRIVLVSLDTLRARSMSVYGREIPTTPLFEALGRQGTLFENAFTTFSNTLGSHMSMFTGLYPASHRVGQSSPTLDPAVPTLAQQLRRAGYRTAAFTENALLRAEAGFERGFSRYFENSEIQDGAGDAEGTFARALAWAAAQPPDVPLFLLVHTYEVHAPHRPPEQTRDRLPFDDAAGPNLRQYEREILHLDALLADFVTKLEAQMADPAELLLVVTADHGEEFLEHGATAHVQLFDEVMHIPLFLRWPGRIPEGLRVDAPVSLVDIPPTVLELAGLSPEAGEGLSLVPLMGGTPLGRSMVFGQTAFPGLDLAQTGHFIARSRAAKCSVRRPADAGASDPDPVCFDLAADPGEQDPLPVGARPEFADLAREAIAYRARALADPGPSGVTTSRPDPLREEKLRQLGYIE